MKEAQDKVLSAEKYVRFNKNQMQVGFIKQIIATYYNASMEDFDMRSRKREVIKLKYMAIYLSLRRLTITTISLGKIFNYDHATILHAQRQIRAYITWDKELEKEVAELVALIDHKLIIGANQDLKDDYHYIDLDNCVGVKQTPARSIVLTGYTTEEAVAFLKQAGVQDLEIVDYTKTGMYLLKKNNNNKTTKQL